jgi:hypothetical protein
MTAQRLKLHRAGVGDPDHDQRSKRQRSEDERSKKPVKRHKKGMVTRDADHWLSYSKVAGRMLEGC